MADSTRCPDPAVVLSPKIAEPWSVDKALATVHPAPPAEGSTTPVPFFHLLERLKTSKREGWRRFGIERFVGPLPRPSSPPGRPPCP